MNEPKPPSSSDPSQAEEHVPRFSDPSQKTIPTTIASPGGTAALSDEKEPPPPNELSEEELGGRMTFLEHLDELRKRILRCIIALVIIFPLCWIFRETIYGFLAKPIVVVTGDNLFITKPTEAFTIYLKVSFIASIFLAVPYLLFQVWMFVAPGLYRSEKTYLLPFMLASTSLFVVGGLFAYYVILPPALNFLLMDLGSGFNKIITAVYFFDFELVVLVGMGAIFQLPVLVAFLSIFGLITPGFMWRNFRYAFLLILIVAAIVSPTTDVINLFLWCGPMVFLYLISIGISWLFGRKRRKRLESL